jgi:hypothetical protein
MYTHAFSSMHCFFPLAMQELKDLTAGTIGGCAGIIVGQPLDTIKVRLQSKPGVYSGVVNCLSTMVRTEGPRSLFKGLLPPLMGNAPMNAIAFGANGECCRRYLFHRECTWTHNASDMRTHSTAHA